LIIKLDDAVNVDPEMFKDFSRGYAYGYGYGYSHQVDGTAGKITKMTAKDYNGNMMSGPHHNSNLCAFLDTRSDGWVPNAPVWEFTYGSSGTAGSATKETKTQDVVKFEYYTIPFDEYIKLQSSSNYTNIIVYSC
jgi:hypothetical protein